MLAVAGVAAAFSGAVEAAFSTDVVSQPAASAANSRRIAHVNFCAFILDSFRFGVNGKGKSALHQDALLPRNDCNCSCGVRGKQALLLFLSPWLTAYLNAVIACSCGFIEVTNLDEIPPWDKAQADLRIRADTAVIVFGDQARLAIGAKQFHHHVGLAFGRNGMPTGSGNVEGEQVFFAGSANLGIGWFRGIDRDLDGRGCCARIGFTAANEGLVQG